VNTSTAAVELSLEELHFLAAAHGVAAVPGLGPLPTDEAALNLLAGTAARSLVGRGLGVYDGDEFLMATELVPLLDVFLEPDWVISAVLAGEDERGLRTWTASGASVCALAQLSAREYGLVGLSLDEVPDAVAGFLELGGDDDGEGSPVELDESSVTLLCEARRVERAGEGAEGVALTWADLGDGGRVLVLEEDVATPTGRRRVLDLLTG
jgi:hypothetical protein